MSLARLTLCKVLKVSNACAARAAQELVPLGPEEDVRRASERISQRLHDVAARRRQERAAGQQQGAGPGLGAATGA